MIKGKPIQIRELQSIRSELINFKGKSSTKAFTMYLNVGRLNPSDAQTKFKSEILTTAKNRYDFDSELANQLVKRAEAYFDPEVYDSQAKSLIYYVQIKDNEIIKDYLIFTQQVVQEYISFGKYFDVSVLDLHIDAVKPRLIVDAHMDETVIYRYFFNQISKVRTLENHYFERKFGSLDFVTVPGGKGKSSLKLGSMQSAGQRTNPELDLVSKYMKQIVELIRELVESDNYKGVHVYYAGSHKEIIEQEFSVLIDEVSEYLINDYGIDDNSTPDELIGDIQNNIQKLQIENIKNKVRSSRKQGKLVSKIDEVMKNVKQGKIDLLYIPQEQVGPGYRKEFLYHYPVKDSRRVASLKNSLVNEVKKYGGTVRTLPQQLGSNFYAILRW